MIMKSPATDRAPAPHRAAAPDARRAVALSTRLTGCATALLAMLTLAGCSVSVNDDVEVADGEERSGGANTVNGDIRIGDDATVDGALRSVNGSIEVGKRARADDVTVVNGSIDALEGATLRSVRTVNGRVALGRDVQVERDASTVNGRIRTDTGSRVGGNVSSISGTLGLRDTEVGGDVSTIAGIIDLFGATRVAGRVLVDVDGDNVQVSMDGDADPARVVVGAGVVVEGGIEFGREGVLWVHQDAAVNGPIKGVQAQPFSGDAPPDGR